MEGMGKLKGWTLRHPFAYLALILVSMLDVIFTCVIVSRGGQELNPIADEVIAHGGLHVLPCYKLTLLLLLVLLCEYLHGRRPRMMQWSIPLIVMTWGLPPAWAILQLAGFCA